jgi:hypothetical protein
MHLKIQPKLSSINVNPSLYQKMRVNLAANIFSFETQAALVYLKDKSPNPKVMETTAHFIGIIAKWFALIESRKTEHLISDSSEHHQSNLDFLNDFTGVIRNITYNTDNR